MKKLKRILYPICIVVLIYAAWNLWKIEASTRQTKNLYQGLAQQAEEGLQKTEEKKMQESTSEEEAKEAVKGAAENSWLIKMQKENPELVGWLQIPGTVIDYPVMQTAEDNDYYLNHDFEGNENPHGALFLDFNCRIEQSDNLVIYGHHMKDGTMFQNLMLYKDKAFCESNKTIWFYMPGESVQYQVSYVMLLSAEDAEKFPYYECIDLSEEELYQGFLKQCSRYAIWADENLPSPGTKLLTLSTCEYSQEDGRLVIIAKAVLPT